MVGHSSTLFLKVSNGHVFDQLPGPKSLNFLALCGPGKKMFKIIIDNQLITKVQLKILCQIFGKLLLLGLPSPSEKYREIQSLRDSVGVI